MVLRLIAAGTGVLLLHQGLVGPAPQHAPALALATLGTIALALQAWQLAVARRFPLHQPTPCPHPTPSISLLKPVHGNAASLGPCLESWLTQGHPAPAEILVGIHQPSDPALPIVQAVLAQYPNAPARIVLCPERPGPNDKACTLAQLEQQARHDIIVVADDDVLARPGLLASVIAPLCHPRVGLVNCLYRNPRPMPGLQSLEALALNADFWSQVLQSRSIAPQDFALGAVVALRRADLLAIGGFRGLAQHLADDFQLGRRIRQRGLAIELATMPADCIEAPANAAQVWRHQLRWARTIRVCRPAPFFLSILSNLTLWSVAGLILAVVLGRPTMGLPWILALLTRTAIALRLHRLMLPETSSPTPAAWHIPLKDLASALVWAAAFLGHSVEWRGRTFRVRNDGTLQPLP